MMASVEGDKSQSKNRIKVRTIKTIMIVSIVIILLGTTSFLLRTQPWLPIYDPLPSAESLPINAPFWENMGNLSISAQIVCDVMDTHRADSFRVSLTLNVINSGSTDITGFHPVKLSIFSDTHWYYFTFGLVPSTNTTILALSNISLFYDGDRTLDTIEGITRPGFIRTYGRVLVSYLGLEAIITTSLFENMYPIE